MHTGKLIKLQITVRNVFLQRQITPQYNIGNINNVFQKNRLLVFLSSVVVNVKSEIMYQTSPNLDPIIRTVIQLPHTIETA